MNAGQDSPGVIKQNDRKTINAWSMYDFANSAFSLVIVSAIFPAYFNNITEVDGDSKIRLLGITLENTAAYSINLGIAFGIIALISPILSSISDYSGNQKSFMKFFCYLGSLGCILLFFFSDVTLIAFGLLGMMLATIGYSGSIVFYNSYLPAIASEDRHDKVSARGYAFGYMGGTTLLIINLIFIQNPEILGVTDETILPRVSFLLTGIWWIVFAQFTFRILPKGVNPSKDHGQSFLNGYHELQKIWTRLKSLDKMRYFLLSFFFYIMGVQTVVFMAASFGEKEIHLETTELIITILLIEYVGIAGAYLFAWISKKTSNITALMIAVSIWIIICGASYFIATPMHFYAAGFFIGMVMGGIQSLSRSTYAKMIPTTENNAGYFSFYDVCEKTAMMCGLLMFGFMDNITGSMRNSIFALGVAFAIGLILLMVVRRVRSVTPMVVVEGQ